jgi:hypothetical protein
VSEIQSPQAQEAIDTHNARYLDYIREDSEALDRTCGRFSSGTIEQRIFEYSVAIHCWRAGTRFAPLTTTTPSLEGWMP